MRHLLITVHGIRTTGYWQERLGVLLRAGDPDVHVFHYKFGYFSLLAFIVPFTRWIVTRRFRRDLVHVLASGQWDRIDIVAHSFGTHLVGWAFYGLPPDRRPSVHTLILAGSVLAPDFPWRELMPTCVRRVVNECGVRDGVLILNQIAVLGTGMAGRIGFSGMTHDRFQNRYFDFGHSGYFLANGQPSDAFMHDRWVPLLLTDGPVPSIDERSQPASVLSGLITFVLNNIAPIKLAAYLLPTLLVMAWLYAQWQRAEDESRIALSRQLALESRGLLETRLDTALLLAVEAVRVHDNPNTRAALLAAIRHERTAVRFLRGHEGPVLALAFAARAPTVVAGGDSSGNILFWSEGSGTPTRILRGVHSGEAVAAIAVDAQARLVASATATGELAVTRVEDGISTRAHLGAGGISLAVSSNGKLIAAGDQDGTVRIWTLDGGYLKAVAAVSVDAQVSSLAFTADASVLAIGDCSAAIRAFYLADSQMRVVEPPSRHQSCAHGLTVESGSGWLAAARIPLNDPMVVYDLVTPRPLKRISLNARLLAVAADVSWRTQFVGAFSGYGRDAGRVLFFKPARFAAPFDREAPFVAPYELQEIQPATRHDSEVTALAILGSAEFATSASRDGRLILWRNPVLENVPVFAGEPDAPTVLEPYSVAEVALRFAQPAARAALVQKHLEDLSQAKQPGLNVNASAALDIDDSRQLLAYVADSGELQMVDLRTRQRVASSQPAEQKPSIVRLSPDGQWVAAATPQTVALRDAATLTTIGEFQVSTKAPVSTLEFDPNSASLTWCSTSCFAIPTQVSAWKAYACRRANRDLTDEEWRRLVSPVRPRVIACRSSGYGP